MKVNVPEELGMTADRDRLRQALANLVDNAIKYTPPGGQVELSATAEGDAMVIRVADNGPGISEQDLPRIFDRLYRGDHSRTTRGLGLGLNLVRAYIEAQGGTVEVKSTPGQGSTFEIRLPRT
jgi:signal transduction histidine kinase